MSYSIKSQEKLEKSKIKMEIEISNGYFNKAINKAYKEISEKAKIPGFRKGKIPFQIIDINYGKEYVLSEAANIAISELYPKIIDDIDLKPVDYPKIDLKDENLKSEMPLGLFLTVEVEPEAELPVYTKIEAEGYPTDVTEEEINTQIDNLRNRFASLEPIAENDGAKKADIATIDFKGSIEGNEFEGGSYNDYVLEIGSGVLLKEIEDALIGAKKNDEKTVKVKMPDEIEKKDIAGKEAEFKITVKEIKRKVLPEVDEEFLKNMGDFESPEKLKEYIKENLEEQKKNNRKNKIFSDIVEYLVKNSKIDLPKIMVDNEKKQLEHDFGHRLEEQKIDKEQYCKILGISPEKMEEDFRGRAEFNVKEYIIFNTLDKELKDKINISDEEIILEKENLIKTAKNDGEKKNIEKYIESPAGQKSLLNSVLRRKVVEFLIENAKIKEITAEELEKRAKEAEKAKTGKTAVKKAKTVKTAKKDSSKNSDSVTDGDKNE